MNAWCVHLVFVSFGPYIVTSSGCIAYGWMSYGLLLFFFLNCLQVAYKSSLFGLTFKTVWPCYPTSLYFLKNTCYFSQTGLLCFPFYLSWLIYLVSFSPKSLNMLSPTDLSGSVQNAVLLCTEPSDGPRRNNLVSKFLHLILSYGSTFNDFLTFY